MTDVFSKQKRSRIMARIKGQNTSPELRVRKALHARGFRFCLHRTDLPGKPDIVLPRHGVAIFVHGCFWHQHKKCKHSSAPKSNVAYWREKFRKNVCRFEKDRRKLQRRGWRVVVIWECESQDERNISRILDKIFA